MFVSLPPLLKLQWIVLASFLSSSAAVDGNTKRGCQRRCGNLTVDYPFGIGEGCYMQGFEISCNTSYDPPRPFLDFGDTKQEVEGISVTQSQVRIRNTAVSSKGFDETGHALRNIASINLTNTPFIFNNTVNKFTVIGCNSLGMLLPREGEALTGCFSVCNDKREGVTDGSCSGLGCCQTSIFNGVKELNIAFENLFNDSDIKDLYNKSQVSTPYHCGYAFLVDQDWYNFEASDLDRCSSSKIERSCVVLDWVIGDQTCEEAEKRWETNACQGMNSICHEYELHSVQGYRCSCKQGYEGNPYNSMGCPDINECIGPNNPCRGKGICINLPGSYNCTCPQGTESDDENCSPNGSKFPALQLGLGIGSLLFLILLLPSVYICLRRRKLIKLKEKFFQQNGGLLLQQQISIYEGSGEPSKIFTAQELAKATDNYAESRVVGQGGNGTVYKGILSDNRVVAVKKSKLVDKNQIEQFINEVVILTQINHRNVVKLLGCCLETEVPLLVYEFVPNGSLDCHIRNSIRPNSISWVDRLRIAIETAGALAYLHSATVIPIIHRDVKSSNILLDDKYTAKVSDFGASRLIPTEQTQITTLVQGTLGYLDPEYFQTSQLTDKSDVYSFGVVLVELLTGQMPVSFARPEAQRNLSSHFILAMKQDRLFQILEPGLANEGNREQVKAVADLAMRCLRLRGEKRPTMKEVALELAGPRGIDKHPWDQVNREEAVGLLVEQWDLYTTENSSSVNLSGDMSTRQYSHNSTTFSVDFPR